MSAFIGALRVTLGIDTAEFQDGINKAQAQMRRVGSQMTSAGKSLSVGLTAPLAAFGALTLKTAGDFEASLNRVAAATSATSSEMESLRKLAMDLGTSTSKSASEAADAIEMLAKNGLTTEQILGGAADASLKLSEATGGELSQAADVATNVMAQFKIEAQDMGKVVDGITGVTLASQFGFDDYALALGQAGGVAAAVGVDLEEFNAALAATSSVFSSGSDAGTSYKNFLVRLVPSSKSAAEAMKELGLQFFEADGTMKSMAGVAEELRTKMSGLSEEDLSDKMSTIFGVDGMRTAIALMDQGAAGVEKFRAQVADASADEQAAARMKGFNGELEKLSGAFETLQIAIASSGFLETITGLVSRFAEFVAGLSETNPELLKWGTIVAGAAAALGPLLIGLGLMVTAMAAISAPVVAVVAGIAAVAAGIAALYAGIQIAIPYLERLGPPIWDAIKSGAEAALTAVTKFGTDLLTIFQALPGQMMEIGRQIMNGLKEGIVSAGAAVVESARAIASDAVSGVKSFLGIHSPSRVMHGVGVNVMQGLGNGMDSMSGAVESTASSIGSTIANAFQGLIDGSKKIKDVLKDLAKQLASSALQSGMQALFGGGSSGGGALGSIFGSLFGGGRASDPWAGLRGFANGGSFQVGGAGGIDSQLVAFRASPSENVSITKPGQERSAGNSNVYHIDARGSQMTEGQFRAILDQRDRENAQKMEKREANSWRFS